MTRGGKGRERTEGAAASWRSRLRLRASGKREAACRKSGKSHELRALREQQRALTERRQQEILWRLRGRQRAPNSSDLVRLILCLYLSAYHQKGKDNVQSPIPKSFSHIGVPEGEGLRPQSYLHRSSTCSLPFQPSSSMHTVEICHCQERSSRAQ